MASPLGDQIFVNVYLLGTLEFGYRGQGALVCIAAEFMGVEGVHRALVRQSLSVPPGDPGTPSVPGPRRK